MDPLKYINKMIEMYEGPRITAQEPRIGLAGGQLVQPGPGRPGYGGEGSGATLNKRFPKLEERAIELLNEGLSQADVSRKLEGEGIIKVKAYERGDKPGSMKKSHTAFNKYYKKLLADGKLKVKEITKVSASMQKIAEFDKVIVDIFKKNPELSAKRIAKIVSTQSGLEVGQTHVLSALRRSDIKYTGKPEKILPEIEKLDKLVKSNARFLSGNANIAEKRNFLFDAFKKAVKNKDFDPDTFASRLKRLGKFYAGTAEDRTADKIYKNIKPPANYLDSHLQKNIVSMLSKETRGIITTAELLGLPQKEIDLLKDLERGAGEFAGNIRIHGDHTDINALMKNFPEYRKNFMRINYITASLNNLKSKTDQEIVTLFNEAKDLEGNRSSQAIKRRNEINTKIKNLRSVFTEKTGLKIGGFKVNPETGKMGLELTDTPRLIDIDSPRWTKLKELSRHLDQKPTNVVDQLIMKGKNIKEVLTKWKGTSEIANSKFIKSFSRMGGKWGKLTKALIGGTIGSVGIAILATAGTTREKGLTTKEMKERKSEMGMVPEVITKNPWTSAGVATAATATTKPGRKFLKKAITGALSPLGAAGLWYGLGGVDPKSAADRMGLAGEAVFAPELVKASIGATKGMKNRAAQKVVQQLLNLGLPTQTALRVARVASPLGLLYLGGEGLYHMYKKGHFDKERMMPSLMDRTAYEGAQREQFDKDHPMFATGGLANLTTTVAPDSGPMQGLASTPEYATYRKEYKWQT